MDSYYFANSVDDIFDTITGTHCPMCDHYEAESNSILKRHFDTRHFKHSIFYEIDGKQACILPCRRECGLLRRSFQEKKRAHFHCPFCEQIYGRSASFKAHLMKTQGNCAKAADGTSRAYTAKNDISHNIMFVQEVEKYEELYNPESEGFANKDEQALAWTSVASVMGEDEMSSRARWKRLKATYHQYLRAASNRLKYTPKHYLSDHMKFLDPYLEMPKYKMLPHTIEIVTDGEFETTFDSQASAQSFSSPANGSANVWTRKSLDSMDDMEEEDLEFDAESPYKRQRTTEFDPDMAFFKSLLPDVQKMDNRQKSRFKRITLGVIEDILYSTASNDSALPSLGSEFVENVSPVEQ